MKVIRNWPLGVVLLGGLLAAPAFTFAAESYDGCAAFVETLPANITTQGVWCLKKDLATSMTSGTAITIATNNVTIDCNGFKLGGLSAGAASGAMGIHADQLNTTVRNCAVRGFRYGIVLEGAGHLVEDNRLDQNLYAGIFVIGENNRVRRNAVYDTGGAPNDDVSFGIYAQADVIDNTIAGVFATSSITYPYGIHASGSGTVVRNNRVRGLLKAGTGYATGIRASSMGMTIADNQISAEVSTPGFGIYGSTNTFCTGNTVVNFSSAFTCTASDGNLSLPAGF